MSGYDCECGCECCCRPPPPPPPPPDASVFVKTLHVQGEDIYEREGDLSGWPVRYTSRAGDSWPGSVEFRYIDPSSRAGLPVLLIGLTVQAGEHLVYGGSHPDEKSAMAALWVVFDTWMRRAQAEALMASRERRARRAKLSAGPGRGVFTTRPDTVEAIRFDGENVGECHAFCPTVTQSTGQNALYVYALGVRRVCYVGDWIVRGSDGYFYPLSSIAFESLYTPTP